MTMPHPTRSRPAVARRHALRGAGLALLVLLALALALPRSAAAHTRLESSAPAAGDTVRGPVTEIRLRFSSTAQTAFTGIELEGPGGAVPVGQARAVGDESREFVIALPTALAPGAYTVRWRTAGRDGHPLRGSFAFVVQPDEAAATPAIDGTPSVLPGATTPIPAPSGEAGGMASGNVNVASEGEGDEVETSSPAAAPLAVALRWLSFLGLLGMVGAMAFRALALRPAGDDAAFTEVLARAANGARRVGALAALLFVATLPFRLWVQTAALSAPGEPFTAAQFSALLASPWGWGWLIALTGAGLVAAALLPARTGMGMHRLAVIGAISAAFSPALMGHAAAVEGIPALAIAIDGVHVLAAAAWMGGLAVLVLAGIPAALGARTGPADGGALAALGALVARFSPVALVSAALAAGTGVASALFHLGAPSQLWTTSYGLTLLAKLALVGLVAAAGFYNWRRVRPALDTEAGARTLRRSAGAELAFGVLVVLATAVLVAQPTP